MHANLSHADLKTEQARQAYPLLDCPELSEREFLLWYDLRAGGYIFNVQGSRAERMRLASDHVISCDICDARYRNMKKAEEILGMPEYPRCATHESADVSLSL